VVNGVDRTSAFSNLPLAPSTGTIRDTTSIELMGRNGAEFYAGQFADVILQVGTQANPTLDPLSIHMLDPTDIAAHTVIGGRNQTAAALNVGSHQGTAGSYAFVPSATNPFSEVL